MTWALPADFPDEVLCVLCDLARKVDGINSLQDDVVRLHRVRGRERWAASGGTVAISADTTQRIVKSAYEEKYVKGKHILCIFTKTQQV